MHVEIQVALNFIISYLFSKLPRRRVNMFGEELDKAMKNKFRGHWYRDKPYKGSAYRCIKVDYTDSVLKRAARESGLNLFDILEYLPLDMSIWVDPGEVSYRIGERGPIKILFTEFEDYYDNLSADREVTKTFNPEAQCFRPIHTYANYYGGFPYIPTGETSSPFGFQPISPMFPNSVNCYYGSSASTPISFNGSPSPVLNFQLRATPPPLTFTTATFAQTKFGSTKLKNSGKRTNRMSNSEFSNYIRREMQQRQMQRQNMNGNVMPARAQPPNGQNYQRMPNNYYYPRGQGNFQPQLPQQNVYNNYQYMPEMYNNSYRWENYQPQCEPMQQNQQNTALNRNPNNFQQDNYNQQPNDDKNNGNPNSNFLSAK